MLLSIRIAVTCTCVGSAMMCICVIYKCLSWEFDQQQDMGKPSLKKIAKPSCQRGKLWAFYPTW